MGAVGFLEQQELSAAALKMAQLAGSPLHQQKVPEPAADLDPTLPRASVAPVPAAYSLLRSHKRARALLSNNRARPARSALPVAQLDHTGLHASRFPATRCVHQGAPDSP